MTQNRIAGIREDPNLNRREEGTGSSRVLFPLAEGEGNVEMKVTWKQSKKKRCLAALPQFSDLPFEHNRDEQPHPQPNKDAEDGASNPEQSQQHSDLEEARQLSREFQAQGDKLAMVYISIILPTRGWSHGSVLILLVYFYSFLCPEGANLLSL